jgi:hypothetical protein
MEGGNLGTKSQKPKFCCHFYHLKLYDFRQVISHFWASLSLFKMKLNLHDLKGVF